MLLVIFNQSHEKSVIMLMSDTFDKPKSNTDAVDLASIREVSAAQAWDILISDSESILVDVRTEQEWQAVGYPDLSSLHKKIIKLSWRTYPVMEINSGFVESLAAMVDENASPLLFLCKSGGRSKEAAIAARHAGFKACYNIVDGYEGRGLQNSHDTELNKGWVGSGLPWKRG